VDELIERLRADAELIHNNGITRKLRRHRVAALLREAAAALEAAREDAERLDSGTIRIIERDEFGMQHTTAYSGVDLRAAIDQARGKAGQPGETM
jgi:hypothetical protein